MLTTIKIPTVAPTCFSSRRNHHQGAISSLAKTRIMVLLWSSLMTLSMLWRHISLLCERAVPHAHTTSWYVFISWYNKKVLSLVMSGTDTDKHDQISTQHEVLNIMWRRRIMDLNKYLNTWLIYSSNSYMLQCVTFLTCARSVLFKNWDFIIFVIKVTDEM